MNKTFKINIILILIQKNKNYFLFQYLFQNLFIYEYIYLFNKYLRDINNCNKKISI